MKTQTTLFNPAHSIFKAMSVVVLAFSLICIKPDARAVDGTWIHPGLGSSTLLHWTNTANWAGGILPGGIDALANFTTYQTNHVVIDINADRTIGNITMIDTFVTNSPVVNINHGVTIQGLNTLTLQVSSGAPMITNNGPGGIKCKLIAPQGFTRAAVNVRNQTMAFDGVGNVIGGYITNLDGDISMTTTMADVTAGLIFNPDGGTNATEFRLTGNAVNWTVDASKIIQIGPNSTNAVGNSSSTLFYRAPSPATNNGSLLIGRFGVLAVDTSASAKWVQNGDMLVTAYGTGSARAEVRVPATILYAGANTIKLQPASDGSGSASFKIYGRSSGSGTWGAGNLTTLKGFESTVTTSTGTAFLDFQGGALVLAANIPQLTTGPNPISISLLNLTGSTNVIAATIDTAGFSTTVNSRISGSGGLLKVGAGTLTLAGTNLFTDRAIVAGGTLALTGPAALTCSNVIVTADNTLDVTGLSSPFTTAAFQTLSNSPSTAFLNGNLNLASGKLALAYSNASPCFQISNGTLTLSEATTVSIDTFDMPFTVGSYKIISKGAGGAVAGVAPGSAVLTYYGSPGIDPGLGATLRITGGELFLDVFIPNLTPVNLTSIVSGNSLTLSWPVNHTGWRLEGQTNNLTTGISPTWYTWPDSQFGHQIQTSINTSNPAVFFRLTYP